MHAPCASSLYHLDHCHSITERVFGLLALKAKSTPTVKAGNLVSDIYHGMELADVLPGLPRHSVRLKFGLFSTQIHTAGHLGHVLPFYDYC